MPEAPVFEDLSRVRARIERRLAQVEQVIAVMSGKGGVGKSAIATNLTLALAGGGGRVGLLDADLNGPSVAKMLGLRGQPLRLVADGLKPTTGPRGISIQSMEFFLQGTQPLEWDGPEGEAAPLRSLLESAALGDLLGQTLWEDLEALVVDLPPGADRLPMLSRLLPGRVAAIVVTIPTEVSLLAVERSVRRAREARVPLIGLVENMGSAVCPSCGELGPLFREAPVEGWARELDLDVIARVPFDPEIAAAADAGRPFLEGAGATSPAGRAFEELAARVQRFEMPDVEAR